MCSSARQNVTADEIKADPDEPIETVEETKGGSRPGGGDASRTRSNLFAVDQYTIYRVALQTPYI